jgi:YYY domain-containing protein
VGLALGILGGVLYVPFYLGFQSQAGGILPNLINPTRLPQFLVFFGPFLFVVVSYLAWLSRKDFSVDWRKALAALALTLGVPVLALLSVGLGLVILPPAREWLEGILSDPSLQAVLGDASIKSLAMLVLRVRLANPWTFLLLGGLLAWVLLLADSQVQVSLAGRPEQGNLNLADTFALTLIGVGLMLPLVVEFVYLRDLFGLRMNTVFKFYYQAWVLLGLAAAYGVFVLSKWLRGVVGVVWQAAVTLLVLAGMVYPVLALPNKAGNFKSAPTLDGMAWLETEHPDDYAAILWLRANAPDGAVILEAPGDSYTYKSRVSALTGLPTVLGWSFHEFQWRGTYDEPARREPDIEILFNTLDPAQTLTLLDKYDITYVYVGPLERSQYIANGLAKFDRLMDVAYQQGQVTIYRRRDVAPSP